MRRALLRPLIGASCASKATAAVTDLSGRLRPQWQAAYSKGMPSLAGMVQRRAAIASSGKFASCGLSLMHMCSSGVRSTLMLHIWQARIS
jgi:hypothetical protein